MTMSSGHKVGIYCNITIFVVTTLYKHRDLNIFRIFLVPEALLETNTLSRCRCCEAKKLLRAQLWYYDFDYDYDYYDYDYDYG